MWVVEAFDNYEGYLTVEFYEDYNNALLGFYDSIQEITELAEDYDLGQSYIQSGAFGDPKSMEYFISDTQYVQLYKAKPYKYTENKPDESLLLSISDEFYVFKDDKACIRHPITHDELYVIRWINNEFKIHDADDWKNQWGVPYNEKFVKCNDEEYKEKLIQEIRELAAEKLLV